MSCSQDGLNAGPKASKKLAYLHSNKPFRNSFVSSTSSHLEKLLSKVESTIDFAFYSKVTRKRRAI